MFHSENRQRAAAALEGALVVMAGYDAMQLSGDAAAPFLQESNFWWLTGIDYPGWKFIFDSARSKVTLVRPYLDDVQAIFNGDLTDEQALAVSGADSIIKATDFEQELKQLARTHTRVMTIENKNMGDFVSNPAQHRLVKQLGRIFTHVDYCNKPLAELRAIKQPAELERMKKAISITVDAFQAVKNQWGGYKTEYAVEADFTAAFRCHNATHAYDPIVAAGEHACTLHYHQNAGPIVRRDATVIDIGARYAGYSADITRTYCMNPSKRLQQVHSAVQFAQQQIIQSIQPEMPVAEYIKQSDECMKEALVSIGLMESMNDLQRYRQYFPHAISHGLGVDTHDSLGAPRYLRPGMVLTVEPGIYIPKERIGVRIEDNLLITATGHQNLSGMLSTDL